MDENKIIDLYTNERYTLRHISEKFKTDHHRIKRILVKNGVEITRRNSLKTFTQEHKDNISKTRKLLFKNGYTSYNKGIKMNREHVLKNMKSHLKYNITLEWLNVFEDIEKLKYLNKSISRKRDADHFTTETYKLFIEKFYYDKKFNELFDKWVMSNDKWIKPSLDHIKAKSIGGTLLLDNLQFISWFENRAKCNIDHDKWNDMKSRVHDYF